MDANEIVLARKLIKDVVRFWNMVEKSDGCWLWKGVRDRKGYGQIRFFGKITRAHRVSASLFQGRIIPSSLDVCHHCDNPPCVRPDHLFIGTRSDNMRDCQRKGRHPNPGPKRKTHCPHGHPLDGINTYLDKNGHRRCHVCRQIRQASAEKKTPCAI